MSADCVWVLTTEANRRAAKLWVRGRDGQPRALEFAAGTFFSASRVDVSGVDELSSLLVQLEAAPRSFIVRGEPLPGRDLSCIRRNIKPQKDGTPPNFRGVARRWLWLDTDKLPGFERFDLSRDPEAAVRAARDRLPSYFANVTCHWQLSASAGMRPGLSLHLAFWLSRAVSDDELKLWAKQLRKAAGYKVVDDSTFMAVQPHYTASPLFGEGVSDPLPRRSGLLRDASDVAEFPPVIAPPRAPRVPRAVVLSVAAGEYEQILSRLGWGSGGEGYNQVLFDAVRAGADAGLDPESMRADLHARVDAATQKEEGSDLEKAHADVDRFIGAAIAFAPRVAHPTPATPGRLRLEVGMAKVREAICAAAVRSGLTAIRASAGVGKSRAALEYIASNGARQVVFYFAPRHDLCEAQAAALRGMNDALRVVVIRGRDRAHDDGEPMCRKHDLANELAKRHLPVAPNLCGRPGSKAGACEFYEECSRDRYRAQFNDAGPAVYFMPHAYLVRRPSDLPDPDLVVIDESPLNAVIGEPAELPLDGIANACAKAFTVELDEPVAPPISPGRFGRALETRARAAAHAQSRAAAQQEGQRIAGWFAWALESAARGEPLLERLRAAEITAEMLEGAAERERHDWPVAPNQTSRAQRAALRDRPISRHAERSALFRALAAELRTGRDVATAVTFREENETARVLVHRRNDLDLPRRGGSGFGSALRVPVILLDADADERLLEPVFGRVELGSVDVERFAHVTQVSDRTGTQEHLSSEETLADLVPFIRRHRDYGRVLVVATKAIETAIVNAMGDDRNGVDVAHFHALRGSNRYETHDVVIVVGRAQSSWGDAENQARALFYDAPEALHILEDGTPPGRERREHKTREGVEPVDVTTHPDERVQACMAQIREREIVQVVDRLRLVRRQADPPRVVLLTNIPTDLVVDRLVTWDELLVTHPIDEAFAREGGEVLVLAANELAANHPDLFGSPRSAARDIKDYSDRMTGEGGNPRCSPENPQRPAAGASSAKTLILTPISIRRLADEGELARKIGFSEEHRGMRPRRVTLRALVGVDPMRFAAWLAVNYPGASFAWPTSAPSTSQLLPPAEEAAASVPPLSRGGPGRYAAFRARQRMPAFGQNSPPRKGAMGPEKPRVGIIARFLARRGRPSARSSSMPPP